MTRNQHTYVKTCLCPACHLVWWDFARVCRRCGRDRTYRSVKLARARVVWWNPSTWFGWTVVRDKSGKPI